MRQEYEAELKLAAGKIERLYQYKIGAKDASWTDMPIGFMFVHCDASVVHAPGRCSSCDEAAFGLQYLRSMQRVNFTGEHDIEKAPCPSEIFRSVENVQRWGGNQDDGHDPNCIGGEKGPCNCAYLKEQQEPTDPYKRAWLMVLGRFQNFYARMHEIRRKTNERQKIDSEIASAERNLS